MFTKGATFGFGWFCTWSHGVPILSLSFHPLVMAVGSPRNDWDVQPSVDSRRMSRSPEASFEHNIRSFQQMRVQTYRLVKCCFGMGQNDSAQRRWSNMNDQSHQFFGFIDAPLFLTHTPQSRGACGHLAWAWHKFQMQHIKSTATCISYIMMIIVFFPLSFRQWTWVDWTFIYLQDSWAIPAISSHFFATILCNGRVVPLDPFHPNAARTGRTWGKRAIACNCFICQRSALVAV